MAVTHKKILLVTSDAGLSELVGVPLRDEGFSVQLAPDATQAQRRVQRDKPDLVIVDYELPGQLGSELCRALRRLLPGDHTRLLLLAGEEHLESLEIGPRAGPDDYLITPFGRADLITKVQSMVVSEEEKRARIVTTGNSELDAKIGGGIPLGSLTLIEGDSGAGKSVLTQQLVHGCLSEGYLCSVFTSENTVKSLVKQMRSLNLDILDHLLLARLRIYPIETSQLGTQAPRILLNAMRCERGRDIVVVDSLTASIPEASDREVIGFFEEAKRLYPDGTTIFIIIHSHGLSKELLSRIRSLCDAHFQLRTEQVGSKLIKTLEVTKVRGADATTGNIVSFEVEPGWGMRVIPINKVKG